MQFFAIASIIAAASAAAIPDNFGPTYQATDFSASCTQHSVMCYYEFDLTNAAGDLNYHCSAKEIGTAGRLPSVTGGACGGETTFNIDVYEDKSIRVSVSTEVPGKNATNGYWPINPKDVVLETDGASQAEKYVGRTSFPLY